MHIFVSQHRSDCVVFTPHHDVLCIHYLPAKVVVFCPVCHVSGNKQCSPVNPSYVNASESFEWRNLRFICY